MAGTGPLARLAACALLGASALAGAACSPGSGGSAASTTSAAAPNGVVTVTITGGFATDPADAGRPVVLIAAALGVPTAVFRQAFRLVTPAAAGEEPDPEQVRRNKAALLSVLGPYGVTNADLDRVSNRYRFDGRAGERWPTTAAKAVAVVEGGKVTAIKVTEAGAGYTQAPRVTVTGATGVTATATVAFGKDLATNGSISSIRVTAG